MTWAGAVIVCAVVAVYWNGLEAPFIWDDRTAIINNPTIRSLWPPWSPLAPPLETPVSRRPIVNLSFALNYRLHELDPRGYHVTNLGIHILAACFLCAVLRRALSADVVAERLRPHAAIIAAAAALWWALHPFASEIVNYTTQRTTALAALFFLITLYAAQRALGASRSFRWQTAAVIACACGVVAKEFVAVVPLVVVLYDRAFAFGSFRLAFAHRKRFYASLAGSWVLLAAVLLLRPHSSVGFAAGVDPLTYALNQAGLIVRYLGLALWPGPLVLDYGFPRSVSFADVWASLLVVLTLLAVAVVALVRWPGFGTAGAAFFLLLAPTSSVIPIATEVGAERRMYLPLAALAALLAVAAAWSFDHVRARVPARFRRAVVTTGVVVAAGWVTALAMRTVDRNEEFASRVTLWESSVERWPHGRSRALYAAALVDAQQHESAIQQLRLAVPDFPKARFALGTELAAGGRYDEAVRELSAFVAAEPRSSDRFQARMLRGRLLLQQQRFDAAIAEYGALVQLRPLAVEPRIRLAHALAFSGRLEDAAAAYRAALHLDWRYEAAHVGLADVLLRAGRIAEGIRHAKAAVELNPQNAGAHNLLGVGLAMNGQVEIARSHFNASLAIDPHHADARRNLAHAEHELRTRPYSSGRP